MKNPYRASLYSVLIPGLGQLYLGERAKGWTFLCMTAGAAVSLIVSHTRIAWFLMGLIYLGIMIPAATDAFQTASGRPRTFTGDTIPYVIAMLLVIGPFAIPLLWQSGRFSTFAKVLCTAVVLLIAIFAFVVLNLMASSLDMFLSPA